MSSASTKNQRRLAFTLIEILVVVAIIALLVAILLPSLSRARENTRRLACGSNLHQIAISASMYAMEHPRGQFIPITGTGGYDGLRYLYPKFLRAFNVAVCPNTKNVVRRPQDLDDNAESREDDRGGHSYESRGWMYRHHSFNGKRINVDAVDPNMSPFPKSTKNIDRPAQVCLISDADDPKDDNTGINNWPDKDNNHGAEGMNMAFCDGHANWTPTGRRLMVTYLSGYYYPGVPENLYTQYKVTKTTESIGGVSYTVFRW
jgi:prepilin-type N-terminal cleavage/methylation domain-containing protein/prepilin-type processing-associated H-X9-DG protein